MVRNFSRGNFYFCKFIMRKLFLEDLHNLMVLFSDISICTLNPLDQGFR